MAEAPGGSWLSHQDTLTNFIVCLVVFHLLAVVRFSPGGGSRGSTRGEASLGRLN